jgi:putative peptidoglycan lipid II flippase
MLAFMLRRRGYFAPDRQLKRRLPRMVAATLIMSAALWGLTQAVAPWLSGSGSTRLLAFSVLVVAGLVIYGLAALLTGAADLKEARRLIGKPPG